MDVMVEGAKSQNRSFDNDEVLIRLESPAMWKVYDKPQHEELAGKYSNDQVIEERVVDKVDPVSEDHQLPPEEEKKCDEDVSSAERLSEQSDEDLSFFKSDSDSDCSNSQKPKKKVRIYHVKG